MPRDPKTLASGVETFLGRPGSVTGVVPLSTGYSNETYLLEGLDVVVRTPPEGPGLLPPYDMKWQHDVLTEVRTAVPDVPVPATFGACTDESLIGAPFYLCAPIKGESFENEAPEWLERAEPGVRNRLCKEWITAVGTLHRARPLRSLGPERTPTELYGQWREQLLRNARECEEVAVEGREAAELLATLADRGYRRSGPAAPVHGDAKIANMMWSDARLAAVLDWELAHNGEPLSDLGYILQWFPAGPRPDLPSFGYYGLAGMFSRQEVISTWETVTGRSADGVEVYEVAALVLTVGIIHQGAVKYATGQLADERLKHWGLILGLYLNRARELLERLPGRRPHRHERPLRSRR